VSKDQRAERWHDKRMREKGVQHVRQDIHEQLKMQERKEPPEVICPSSVITL
jgi:hypothetical protein